MKNLGGNIKSLRNFMRKDAGVSGDALQKFIDQDVVEVERGYSSVELLGMLHDSFKKSDDLLDSLNNLSHFSKVHTH